MQRILLVTPNFESDFAMVRDMLNAGKDQSRSLMVPLQHATLAALTPDEFEVDIWDEGFRGEITESTNFGKHYDLVGVTNYVAQTERAIQLAHLFRKRGSAVVIGGPGVSSSPEVYRGIFDVIFLGEAELTWPRFLRDWKKGNYLKEYRQVERIDMSLSPVPRWDSIAADVGRYELGGVQTTRGCPFDCEFCDVIHLFGRKPRHKPIEHVIQEIVNLQKLGIPRIFLCDDDFVGDKKWAKQLLRELIPVNNSFKTPLAYVTQSTIDAAEDEELLALMADCNFVQLYIGIETPRAASLRETHKLQNLRSDLVESCRKIHSYGIGIKALMIVGFDSDDADIFKEQLEFVEAAQLTIASVRPLRAYPGTPLWIRLQQQNRIFDISGINEKSSETLTNIIPKQMTLVQLLEGYRGLLTQLRSWEFTEKQFIAFISSVTRKPNVKPPALLERLKRAKKLLAGALRRRKRRLPPEARMMFRNVLMHTIRTKPFMLGRIVGILMQQLTEIMVYPHDCKVIQEHIDDALTSSIRLDKDPTAGTVAPAFRKKVRDVLPLVYDRLAVGIPYRPAVPEAMVGVIKDFVIRWGENFVDFEPHHHVYLHELCDRHIERWQANNAHVDHRNDGVVEASLGREQAGLPQFVSALLVSVEQELRADVRPAALAAGTNG
jgi:radical SAM superfamily enzyme YgiQ (UPF0313 family)